jgi:hypothetical protein
MRELFNTAYPARVNALMYAAFLECRLVTKALFIPLKEEVGKGEPLSKFLLYFLITFFHAAHDV